MEDKEVKLFIELMNMHGDIQVEDQDQNVASYENQEMTQWILSRWL